MRSGTQLSQFLRVFLPALPLIFHANLQLNISNVSGQEADIVIFAIFSNGGHLGYSTRPNFTIRRPSSQVMLHVKFKNYLPSGFREIV